MFNLFKTKEKIPKWFPSNLFEDFYTFTELIEKTRQEKLSNYKFSNDKSSLVLMDENGKQSQIINLNNLAVICIRSNKNEWEQIIIKTLSISSILSLNEGVDFEDIKSIIVTQIYPKNVLEQTGDIQFVSKEIIPETINILVFDRPDSIESIKPDTIKRWGKNQDELFELAISNTKKILEKLPFEDIGHGSKVQVGESENVLTSCASLFLQDIYKQYNEKGVIFTIPNRNTITTLEITDLDNVTKELPFLSHFTENIFANSPYPINSNLYWLKDKKYFKLPYEIKDNKFNFSPPQEFLDILNSLV